MAVERLQVVSAERKRVKEGGQAPGVGLDDVAVPYDLGRREEEEGYFLRVSV